MNDNSYDNNQNFIHAIIVDYLSDRNQDIIQKYLSEIKPSKRSGYIEDKVYCCIEEIAIKEGRIDLVPKSDETLSEWRERDNMPTEYMELEGYLNNLFSNKHNDLSPKKLGRYKKSKSETMRIHKLIKLRSERRRDLYKRNYNLIVNFLQIAERKVSIIDDYGDENWGALSKEIDICLKKIYQLKDNSDFLDESAWLKNKLNKSFLAYHKKVAKREASIKDIHKMSGVDFESWVVKILKENGFNNVRGTPAVGDQGADIIAERNGRNIVIQAKRYKGTVGNKAVQEVISAVQYYGSAEGWVITNSTFTTSAKALAQKSKIKLIDGKALSQIKNYI